MKILLDTNVLIAALITRGICNELLEHCLRHHQIVLSEFLLDEFQDHLFHKFHYTSQEIQEAVELLRLRALVVVPVQLAERICRDVDDDQVLGTALAGQVDCMISGDKDLLELKNFQSIPVLKPSEFSAFEGDYHA
jgi:putative PIN family toxin of toxin-antitoxin system